jgi:RHS repeat-associated protein
MPGYTGGIAGPDGTTRLGMRVLDGALGRWTTPDPTGLREVGGQDGLYVYVADDPVGSVDPTGGKISLGGAFDVVKKGVKAVNFVKSAVHVASGVKELYDYVTGPKESSAPNRATNSFGSVARQDGMYRPATGPATRLNQEYNSLDMTSFGSEGDGVACVTDNYVSGINGGMASGQAGSKLAQDALSGKPSASMFEHGVDFFTTLFSSADRLHSC